VLEGSLIEEIRSSRRRWYVLAVLAVGLFMLLLDGTIVNIAIPSIMGDLGARFSEIEWVMNSYLLVFAVSLITMGRLGDMYGRRRLFLVGISVFTAASFACGVAPSAGWLIGFRAVQGLGGAMMMPATLSIIAYVFPVHERGTAMGIWGAVSGIATALGPTLGGLIVDGVSIGWLFDGASWPFIFLINVPIGVGVILAGVRIIPESTDPSSSRHIDYAGVAVLSVALFCLTFALIEGQKLGWTSTPIIGLFAGAAAGIGLFMVVERRVREPLMQLDLFRSRTFSAANITGTILSFGMMGIFFLLPLFLQSIMGFSAVKAGLVMTPLSAMVVVGAPFAGRLSDRIGSRWLIFGGMLLAAGGFLLMRTPMQLDTYWPSFVIPFMVTGLGIGLVMAPMTSAVMSSAPLEKAGAASGILSTMRQMGSVLGIAVMGAVLQNRAVAYIETAAEQKLAAIPLLPDEVKRRIVDSLGDSVANMSELQTGAGMGGLPAGAEDMLAQAPPEVVDIFRELFGRELLLQEFVQAMRTTVVIAVVVLLLGALVALVIRSHVAAPVHAPAGDGLEAGTEPLYEPSKPLPEAGK
jgi:EmrB/QacA subfamily drug resistance transporter